MSERYSHLDDVALRARAEQAAQTARDPILVKPMKPSGIG
jgi:hypothetical protein